MRTRHPGQRSTSRNLITFPVLLISVVTSSPRFSSGLPGDLQRPVIYSDGTAEQSVFKGMYYSILPEDPDPVKEYLI